MGTVANIMPCPCCDRGGFDYEPCPSRVDIDKFTVEVVRLRAKVRALQEALAYTLRIIDYETPPPPDPRGDEGEEQSQFYRAEGLMAARALLPSSEEPEGK
jgi:hypothetical protein